MDFYEVLDQVVALLKQRGRASYQALRIQFKLDEESLDALKFELIEVQELATDRDGKMLVWTGETEAPPVSTPTSPQSAQQEITQEDQPPQAAPPAEPPTPDAERRQLTVMFSDLVDSTKLSGQLDPEDYREVLHAYQTTCSEVIHRFDGYIAQHLGDALLVYFGYPQAHEDDAQRAIHTGLGMLQAMKTLNERLEQDKGIRLAVRVGIHTGLTVISDVGSAQKHEMLALGEAPNVASRIQSLAEPDTIAMSADTHRLVQGYFTMEDLGLHSLKGVAEPQQVYRVLQESGAQSRLEIASARGLTPLVGREQEVGLLLERWHQVKDGQGQIVLLSGEGGIGKSRLVQVLKDHVADEPHTRWECRSSPYYQNTALYPITDLFQRTLQFQADDTPELRLEKLERELSQYRLPLEESVPLFAPLLSLPLPAGRYPPLAFSPQRQRQKTLESILAILLAQAEQHPVLFVLEDLHWTDPTTLELLDLLIDQSPTVSICALFTCRPAFQPTWSHRSYLTEMTLNRLSQNQIERMAEQVVGGKKLPGEILQQIVEKTDGVPLFVEEITKVVLESGALKEVNGQYELAGSLTSLTIPATLQDSLMARLDRLVTAKAVAQYASVIGRQFSYQLLQAVSQLDQTMLQHELKRLVDAELLYQRGLPPQATYTFKHALIQDTAYASLLRSTRQQYHARIATVLESHFPNTIESQPELLAHHYTEAGLHEQAVDYWQRAGKRADERSAHVEAVSHLRAGLKVLNILPETLERHQRELDILLALRPPLSVTKGFAGADLEPVLIRARELCEQVENVEELLHILAGLGSFYQARAEYQTAHELAEQQLALAQRTQDATHILGASRRLAGTLFWRGELLLAREHLEQVITSYDPQQRHVMRLHSPYDWKAHCLSYEALIVAWLGYPEQAVQKIQEALDLAQALDHPFSIATVQFFTAWLHYTCRHVRAAQECAEVAVALSDEHGFPYWQAAGTVIRGWALAEQGQIEEGIAQIHQGLASYQVTGAGQWRPCGLAQLAEACGKDGQVDKGIQVLTEAQSLVDHTGERWWETELYRLKGELLQRQTVTDVPQVEACFQQALKIARHQQARLLELRAATSLARLWQSQDKRQEAYDLLVPVYGWFTEGFDTADLIDAKALLDELA
jgi:class 3 adenylate cyclase/predicted ATPase